MSVPTGRRPPGDGDRQAAFAATLVDEWARAGVTRAVVCPGSRSTPLALALSAEPRIGIHVRLDERSSGFTALGIGIVRYVANAESAPAVANAAILPLTFISGIWFHFKLPAVLSDIGKVFPIRALAHGMQYAFNPFTRGAGFSSTDLLTLAIWLVVGLAAMVRFLRQPYRA